jgi:glycerol-3-phosphate O-acyltransferase
MEENAQGSGPAIFSDEQTVSAIQELFGFPHLIQGMKAFFPAELSEHILHAKDRVRSVADFQEKIAYPILKAIQADSISKLTVSGLERLDPAAQYLFVSNHRDIILDSAFLNIVLFEHGFRTSQIAIGDNLMRHRISELIFHINKSFVVKRSGTPMELYRYSVRLSRYIREQIVGGIDSVWIAQREGRAKNGDDRTQVGMLKMLSLSAGEEGLKAHFKGLNMVPVSISYEFDPCDLLKAQEFLNKKADPAYKKTFEEDLQHMLLGLKGRKGAVHFHFSEPFGPNLEAFDELPNAKRQLEWLAEAIDRCIHRHYALCPINYVANDLLNGTAQHPGSHYTPEERKALEGYFEERFQRMRGDSDGSGKQYLLKMYANPLLNYLSAQP